MHISLSCDAPQMAPTLFLLPSLPWFSQCHRPPSPLQPALLSLPPPLPHLRPHLALIVSVLWARLCGEVNQQWPMVMAAATRFSKDLFSSLRVSLPCLLTFSLALVLCFADSLMRVLRAQIATHSGERDGEGSWGWWQGTHGRDWVMLMRLLHPATPPLSAVEDNRR